MVRPKPSKSKAAPTQVARQTVQEQALHWRADPLQLKVPLVGHQGKQKILWERLGHPLQRPAGVGNPGSDRTPVDHLPLRAGRRLAPDLVHEPPGQQTQVPVKRQGAPFVLSVDTKPALVPHGYQFVERYPRRRLNQFPFGLPP
jgi:hypothetical protein